MKPEEIARQGIDKMLEAAGWVLQDMKDFNRKAALGVAVREFKKNSELLAAFIKGFNSTKI